jgi:hypothetical protein
VVNVYAKVVFKQLARRKTMKKTVIVFILMMSGVLLFATGMQEKEAQAYYEKIDSLISQGAGKSRAQLASIPGIQNTADPPRVEIPYSDATHRDLRLTIYYNLSSNKASVESVSVRYSSRTTSPQQLKADMDYFSDQALYFLIYYGAYSSRIKRGASEYVYRGNKHTGRLTESQRSITLELDKPADIALFSDPKLTSSIENDW